MDNAQATRPAVKADSHVKIVVHEGRVTLEDLHLALERTIKDIVRGGCNCGLTGFDISFVRGDPAFALNEVSNVANIQGAFVTRGQIG